jgi:formylglycine-generating enzyme required for sulfatase activity
VVAVEKPEVPAEARKEPDISQGSTQAQVFEVPEPDLGVTSKDVMQSVPEKASRDSRFLTLAGVEYVKIPGGKFLVGSKDDDPYSSDDERPQHTFQLPTYWMSRFPVTNEQYAQFVQAVHKKHPVKDWEAKPNHPVMDVSWNDAQEYVQWLNTRVQSENQAYGARLPTEAEWEKAARGTYGSLWPWGNEFDPARCNCAESKKGSTTPVGDYSPVGDSPYGCADMAGNVWEWTQSLYKIYPYNPNDGREALDQNNAGRHVLRGGSFSNRLQYVRCAYRNSDLLPDTHSHTVGFRTVVVLTSVW